MNTARILLADDHPVVIEGLKNYLSLEPARWQICGQTADGREAIAKAVELAPDLLIIDDEIPRLNGLDTALEIRREAPAVETLLFISAHLPGVLARFFHSKVRGCLLKSEALEELTSALETIRRHHQFRSRGITDLCENFEKTVEKTEPLTRCEIEIIRLIAQGYSSKEIATRRGVSVDTITSHRTHIFRKLHLHSAMDLMRYAIQCGLIEL